MLRYCRKVLFGEPLGGPVPRWNLDVGCFCTLAGSFMVTGRGFAFLPGPMNVALGLMFIPWSVSDLLPRGRKTVIDALRVMFLVCMSTVLVLSIAGILRQAGF